MGNNKSSIFNSPLFIVGLSRSGTKLVRDLLNNHPLISIPDYETHFIPSLIDLNKDRFHFKKSIELVENSKFYKNYKDVKAIDITAVKESLNNSEFKLTSFIEWVLKFYSGIGDTKGNFIWGDKTPKNLRFLTQIRKVYPNCKFIHIIRDPRDRTMSMKNTWWKSIKRSAYLWNKEIKDSQNYLDDKNYVEVKYEDLVSRPEIILSKLCRYLGVDFVEEMTILNQPSEKYGNASSSVKVVSSNTNKFLKYDKKIVKRIEELTFETLIDKDYEVFYATKSKGISKVELFYLRIYDFIMFKLSVKKKGY